MKFVTKVYHPNIKTDTGDICADVITNSWAPTVNLRAVIGTVKTLLMEPNTDSPLEAEIAELYASDQQAFVAKAKAHTAEYATV